MKIAVLIPAHNEAKAIGPLVESVRLLGFDVIVIDDGSVDGTGDLACASGAVLLRTPARRGKGGALRQGFDYSVAQGYEAVILMDGDGQHAPSDLAAFTRCYGQTHADIISGNRMANPQGMPLLRLLTNHFMSWLISLFCRQPVPDTQCGFRFIKTDVLRAISIECSGFEIETEILIKASKKGFKVASVPIQSIYRDEISKIKPVKDTLRFIRFILKEGFRREG